MKTTTSKFLVLALAPPILWFAGGSAHADTFTVTNTFDSGPDSLRQAISDANSNPGPDTIEFNISLPDPNFLDVDSHLPGGDVAPDAFVITPAAGQPAFVLDDTSGGTIIDGRTQTRFTGDTNPFGPEIVLDGSSTDPGIDGFRIFSGGNEIFDLNLQSFKRAGIFVSGYDNNWIAGNYIGTDPTGTAPRGNAASGVWINSSANFNLVGTNGDGVSDGEERNIISGGLGNGVAIALSSHHNVVAGNFIGTDRTGTGPLGNNAAGINIGGASTRNRVEDNTVSANRLGIIIAGEGTDENIVAGNFIGTDKTGTLPLGNHGWLSLLINNGAERNLVEENLISANPGNAGVEISNGSAYNTVANNCIGTDETGTVALGNNNGVALTHGAHGNLIEGNLISGNEREGVTIAHAGTDDNVVTGNLIGTDESGTVALPNGLRGVLITDGAQSNPVGSNVIAFNGDAGVLVFDSTTSYNSIRGNSIHSNGALGIDLGNFGVTANDSADSDVGANTLQNFPDLLWVLPGHATVVDVKLDSIPNETFEIDFYASATVDPSGHGEGERYLETISVTTDAAGIALAFGVVLSAATSPLEFVTATATDANGNTSEFSGAFVPPTVADIPDLIANLGAEEQVVNSLGAMAESAADSLEAGNTNAAGNKLEAIKKYANAQRGKKLTDEEADLIIRFVDESTAGL